MVTVDEFAAARRCAIKQLNLLDHSAAGAEGTVTSLERCGPGADRPPARPLAPVSAGAIIIGVMVEHR